MGESVCVDVETIPLGGKECVVETSKGPISVFVCGDREKPALVTYPDVALNYMSCFQGLFFCPEAASLLLHNFCIYHIDAPGHELGAASISTSAPVLSVDELADQVAEVIDFFGIKKVMCLGVSAGAYVLTLFAVKYSKRVLGLILVSPLCKAPSWTEWFYNMVLLNMLYYYGMCGLVKDCLLQRYFSKDVRSAQQSSESDIAHACRKLLDERQSLNVMRFLQAINQRRDLSRKLGMLKCRTLIFVGDKSPFYSDACHMISKLDKRYSTLVEVQVCGSLVTEEQPHAMLIPMEFFLMRFGIHRQQLPPAASTFATYSKASPESTTLSVPAELFSPEALGIKLKPIRTRVTVEV